MDEGAPMVGWLFRGHARVFVCVYVRVRVPVGDRSAIARKRASFVSSGRGEAGEAGGRGGLGEGAKKRAEGCDNDKRKLWKTKESIKGMKQNVIRTHEAVTAATLRSFFF